MPARYDDGFLRNWRAGCFAWLTNSGKASDEEIISHHMCAVSTNTEKVTEFGIDQKNMFEFWDWVGGRYSVSSAVGLLPLSLQYSYEVMSDFLDGAHDIDMHFLHAPIDKVHSVPQCPNGRTFPP